MSRANFAICTVLLAGLVATIALGLPREALLLGFALVLGVLGIYRGRRVLASDVDRVDALEYLDERDRAIARDGFAVVGALALVVSTVEFVLMSALAPDWAWLPTAQTLLLATVWAFANHAAARRR
jgi:hypothetical protein